MPSVNLTGIIGNITTPTQPFTGYGDSYVNGLKVKMNWSGTNGNDVDNQTLTVAPTVNGTGYTFASPAMYLIAGMTYNLTATAVDANGDPIVGYMSGSYPFSI